MISPHLGEGEPGFVPRQTNSGAVLPTTWHGLSLIGKDWPRSSGRKFQKGKSLPNFRTHIGLVWH